MTGTELTAAEAAALAQIAESTWRAYVARGGAPAPTGYSSVTGRRVWSESAVRQWLATRPGPGFRADLNRPAVGTDHLPPPADT